MLPTIAATYKLIIPMTRHNVYLSFLLAAGLSLLAVFSSCINEDLSKCPHPFDLHIKAIDAEGQDITTSGEVRRAIVFLLDEKGKVYDAQELDAAAIKSRKSIRVNVPHDGPRHLEAVVWGNVDETLDHTATLTLKQKQDLYVRLRQQGGYWQTPPDLFRGTLGLPIEIGGIENSGMREVVITRQTAQVIITVLGLRPEEANEWKWVLRPTATGIDAEGKRVGDAGAHLPAFSFNPQGQYVTPLFNTLPREDGQPYVVELYHKDKLFQTFTTDRNGKSFQPQVGHLLNIIIGLDSQVFVLCEVTPWGQVYQYVEY